MDRTELQIAIAEHRAKTREAMTDQVKCLRQRTEQAEKAEKMVRKENDCLRAALRIALTRVLLCTCEDRACDDCLQWREVMACIDLETL
jgi:hypothetical protein